MEKLVNLYPDAETLYSLLKEIRKDASRNNAKNRTKLISPLLNSIVEKECN